ncbi:heme/hemin ABC transporter substrate-binding protein [Fluviicola taffensis]|uniref:Periplasmic binding protein n=1 Tax=Fluviicola taffensis (strain DSM 16823 / NCIMB 13979 / RW262) TaxID=755732 RepID=F2IG52_FLUTR|nr:ABC transporter substrate-binding protein [Fluviicola taffensis]AEA44687.1 periplasmic binding protein [Fluviicola taffensis DSM 16823]
MKKVGFLFLALLSLTTACNSGSKSEEEKAKLSKEKVEEKRIVSLNGSVTEIIYAVDSQKELIGVDVTSTFPAAAEKLTNLGHVRKLAIESLLALNPSHVVMLEDEVSPDLKSKLKQAKIELVTFKHPNSLEESKSLVKEVASWLGKSDKATEIVSKIDSDIKNISKLDKKPKVLFVYARGAGTLMVAGEQTPLEKMIVLAGGENAGKGFTDFKPLTSESVIAANPDVILMFTSGAQSLGPDGIFNVPGVSSTNAGKNKALIQMDGQLLSGFGPRVADAIVELNKEFKKVK